MYQGIGNQLFNDNTGDFRYSKGIYTLGALNSPDITPDKGNSIIKNQSQDAGDIPAVVILHHMDIITRI